MNGRVTPSRRAALDVLRRVRAGELADRALDQATGRLDPRDHGFTQELVYGTFRLRGRLDHLLGGLVKGGTAALEPDVLDVLRLGAYQLLEMGGVPAYAAISQSVDLVRIAGSPKAAGLVNGVLQNLQRRGDTIPVPDAEQAPGDYLSTWGSHPRWLVDRWIGRWGAEATRSLVDADNTRPELYLRPLGISVAEAVERLAAAGIGAEPVAFSPDSLRVLPPASAADALAAVPAVVQDPAAALVVRYAAVPAGATVLDLCAAPGGKAFGLASTADHVVAADNSYRRLARVRENARRLDAAHRVRAVVSDARNPAFRPADAVLLDAPCTGTGTFRRHPDGRWRVGEGDLDALAKLQAELLDAAAPLVRGGGLLVYSTCSLEGEENEVQIDAFLGRHPEFSIEPPNDAVDAELLDDAGRLSVLPQRQGVDGAFAARLRRTA
ncbi:MAG TPA: 16S rRNA (cytosine(967)-C(5))-methyltransferase RsmB [Longimicrobiaceae bacterium]|nr:16S rRNA (cytosine(967)-C(5))-methyltransferase RsmB [Longimicrobiaceae bacterium]